MFIDIWEWPRNFHRQAVLRGDTMRAQLWPLYQDCWGQFEANSSKAELLLRQGRALAESAGEPFWVVFFDYWLADLALWYQQDFNAGLERAVRAAVEARKPAYQNWPFTPRVHYTLASAYSAIDPLSYADLIREVLGSLETDLNYDIDVWRLIPGVEWNLCQARSDAEGILKAARTALDRSQNDSFRLSGACDELCYASYFARRFEDLLELGQIGEMHARAAQNRRSNLASLQLWQAIGASRTSDTELARRKLQSALATLARLGDSPRRAQIMALPFYYEVVGDLDKALVVRQDQLARAIHGGNAYNEYCYRLQCCRLSKIMGTLTEADVTAARAALQQLKDPTCYPPLLDHLLAGDTSEII